MKYIMMALIGAQMFVVVCGIYLAIVGDQKAKRFVTNLDEMTHFSEPEY